METIDLTESQNPIETVSALDAQGQLRVGFKLKKEDYEMLKALKSSPAWALYRALLVQVKNEFFNMTLSIDDPNKVMKQVGLVSGINLAINQLAVLAADYERALKKEKELADKEKKSKPS